MKIATIAAMEMGKGIGYKGNLPWHFKEDLKYFKQLTLNKTVIMGKNTFLSLKKPLKDRDNFIVSSSLKEAEGCKIFNSLTEALSASTKDVFIIGGPSLYGEALYSEIVDEIYLTLILGNYPCDKFFPRVDWEKYDLSTENTIIENRIPLIFLKGTRK